MRFAVAVARNRYQFHVKKIVKIVKIVHIK